MLKRQTGQEASSPVTLRPLQAAEVAKSEPELPDTGASASPAEAPSDLASPGTDTVRPAQRFRPGWTIADAPGPPKVRARESLYRRTLACADMLSAALAVLVSITYLGDGDAVEATTLLALPIVVLVSKVIGLYDRDELRLRKTTLEEAPALFQLATLYAVTVWLLGPLLMTGELGRSQFVGFWMMLFLFSLLGRTAARALIRHFTDEERCVVVGGKSVASQLGEKLTADSAVNAKVVGVLPLEDEGSDQAAESLEHVRAALSGLDVHRALIVPEAADSDYVVSLIRLIKSLGIRVSVLPGTVEVVGASVELDEVQGLTVLGVRRFGLTRSSRLVKRGFDFIASAFGLVLALPVFAGFALAIKLDSAGPVFFRQTRIGRQGKQFKLVKFRTMEDDADNRKRELVALNEADGLFKIAKDPRITRVGRFLRRTSLDELPQLWNVLRGEMSLVGPRPLVVEDDQRVEGWHRRRLQLTPGMTGHWQILGSSRIPLREMVEIDYVYVANWSLWTDIKILLRTLPYVIGRRGL